MTNETNIFSSDENATPLEKARAALLVARQYQQDWLEQGVDRVHKYFDDVEGDWLENFTEVSVDASQSNTSKVTLLDIVAQLSSLGLPKSFIKKVAFPSWWQNGLEGDDDAISRLLKSLAKRLRLDVAYGSPNLSLSFVPVPAKKFKLQKRQENPELYSYLATSVANIVLGAVDTPYKPISVDPLVVRKSILKGNSYVSLDSLLNFCWDCGIPVIQFNLNGLFSKSPKCMSDGLVIIPNHRPAIIIGSSRKHSAWLLFILAHELGHIAHNHLTEGILSDESLKESFKEGVNDEEEDAANQFASQLLFGDKPLSWDKELDYRTLLNKTRSLSKNYSIDIGACVLNYAWKTGDWRLAMVSLNQLEPNANAPAKVNATYQRHSIGLDEDSREYLEQVKVLVSAD
jgi:IrrE N-terminal-like domain